MLKEIDYNLFYKILVPPCGIVVKIMIQVHEWKQKRKKVISKNEKIDDKMLVSTEHAPTSWLNIK